LTCSFLAQSLDAAGFSVRTDPTGEIALHEVASQPWHTIVVERHLPGIDGFETILRARAQAPALPAVMATHHVAHLSPEQALILDAYLVKPLKRPEAVEVAVHRAVVARASKLARDEMTRVLRKISSELQRG
jgi:DNA-binding response OmpR family regulator